MSHSFSATEWSDRMLRHSLRSRGCAGPLCQRGRMAQWGLCCHKLLAHQARSTVPLAWHSGPVPAALGTAARASDLRGETVGLAHLARVAVRALMPLHLRGVDSLTDR